MPRGPTSNRWNFPPRTFPISGILRRALALGFFLLAIQSASARVYWIGSGGETAGVLAPDSSWSRAYATMVRINGGRAGVEVWSAGLSLEETVESLRARFAQNGSAIWFNGTGEMVWAIATDGDHVFRFLLSAGFGPRSCQVFQISQTTAEFKASLEPPKTHQLKQAPEYPGSTPKSFLAAEKTRTSMAGAETPSSPEDVQQFYASNLKTSGWVAPLGPGKNPSFYIRGNEALLVSTQTSGDGGATRIMLLHKPLAVTEEK